MGTSSTQTSSRAARNTWADGRWRWFARYASALGWLARPLHIAADGVKHSERKPQKTIKRALCVHTYIQTFAHDYTASAR